MIIFYMRIFVDIGAHYGESVFKALNPALNFQEIHAFEPSGLAFSRLNQIRDRRFNGHNFGLGAKDEYLSLFGSGHLGASLFEDKKGASTNNIELISVKSASHQLRKILEISTEAFIKINCEGGEIDILEDLMNSGLILKCTHLYVDWDARKVPSLTTRYKDIRSKLEKTDVHLVSSDTLPVSGWKGVELWLHDFQSLRVGPLDKIRYVTFSFLPLRFRVIENIKRYAPFILRVYLKLGRKL